MHYRLLSAFSLTLVLWTGIASAQTTVQQDRRIEEEKREELKPTHAAGVGPAAPPAKEAPVPQPLEAIYFLNLLPKRITYGYDAAKVIMILMRVDEEYIGLDAQVGYLKEKGFLPPRLRDSFDPMAPLRKGACAYMLSRALGIRGGIARRLLPESERYALKELAFQGIMGPGHVNDIVSGPELVQAAAQAASRRLTQEESKGKR